MTRSNVWRLFKAAVGLNLGPLEATLVTFDSSDVASPDLQD